MATMSDEIISEENLGKINYLIRSMRSAFSSSFFGAVIFIGWITFYL